MPHGYHGPAIDTSKYRTPVQGQIDIPNDQARQMGLMYQPNYAERSYSRAPDAAMLGAVAAGMMPIDPVNAAKLGWQAISHGLIH